MTTKPSEITKPVRPLTAYHLFFQLERAWLLQNIDSPDNDSAETNEGYEMGKLIDSLMPKRYREIYMSKTWYASASGKRAKNKESDEKRKHRKSHGKISFKELSSKVASRWKVIEEIDPETKKYCAMIAKRELQSYKEKVKMYKASIADEEVRSARSSIGKTNSFASAGSDASSVVQSYSESPIPNPQHQTFIAKSPGLVSASSIVQNSYESPIPNPQHQTRTANETKSSGLVTLVSEESSTFDVSSDFVPTWMKGKGKLNMTGYSSDDVKTSPVPKRALDDEFSFIPVPPSLQEREDAFLKRCQKRARLLPINSPGVFECDQRTDCASINDVVFDSTMRDLDTRMSYAINDECKDDQKISKKIISAADMPHSARGDLSPLRLGDSISWIEYKFTEDDAEMLLKALF